MNKCAAMMSAGSSNDCLMDKLYVHLKELQCISTVYVNLAYIYMMSNMGNSDTYETRRKLCGGQCANGIHFSPKYYFSLPLVRMN
jgi:hypothetical protein